MKLLSKHREEEDRERCLARDLRVEKGYVLTSPTGEQVEGTPGAAGLRDGRHTAGTILLILGAPDTVVDAIMGWEPGQSARTRRRYQHR